MRRLDSTSPITTCNGILLDFSTDANMQNMPTPVDQTINMTIPFEFGTPADFAVYACSVASMAAFTDLAGQVSVDFSHTGVFEKATVLDGLGQKVPGATVTSASRFDYLGAPAGSTTTTLTTSSTTSTTSTLGRVRPSLGGVFLYSRRCAGFRCLPSPRTRYTAPVAQLDRASGFEAWSETGAADLCPRRPRPNAAICSVARM